MIQPGSQIGSIRIVDQLGEGGMGSIFVGFDEKLQREVALKSIRSDRLDDDARVRLLYEARVLSQLEHPNICRIYDFIDSEEGDFLVLELVQGKTLRQALGEALPLSERLDIAEQVARALIAAHSKGIIHRDLKLDNVMLTPSGRVKVLDFGLARALDQEPPPPASASPSPQSEATEAPATAGSPDATTAAEEAPEKGEPEAVPPKIAAGPSRVRESMSQSRSWVPSTYQQTAYGNVVGTVTSMSPEQARGEPATAASDIYSFGLLLQELLTGEAPYEASRSVPTMLLKVARGETRPVQGLAPDLTRLIDRLQSVAPHSRPSAAEVAERLRWIRDRPARRRLRLALAALVLTAIAFGFKYTVDLERERRLALEARDEAEEVTKLLVELFEVSDPGTARGRNVTAREILDRGAERIGAELEDRPRIRARLLVTIGEVYRQLGLYEQAAPLLEEALEMRRELFGERSLEVADSLYQLGRLKNAVGRYEEAEEFYRPSLELREELLGPDHPRVAEVLTSRGSNRSRMGELEEGEKQLRRALEIHRLQAPESAEIATSLQVLGSILGAGGEIEEAGRLYQRSLEIRQRLLGDDHPDLLLSLVGLAVVSLHREDYEKAEELFKRALTIQTRVLGPDHPNVSLTLLNLAQVYRRRGRLREAEPLLRRALEIRRSVYGADHPEVGMVLQSLGLVLSHQRHYEEAIEVLEERLRNERQSRGADHLAVISALRDLATVHYEAGSYRPAEELFRRHRSLIARRLDAGSADDRLRLVNADLSLGEVQRAGGDRATAFATWQRARALAAELVVESDATEVIAAFATVLLCLEEIEEARPWVEKAIRGGWDQPDFLELARRHQLLPVSADGSPAGG